MKGRAGPPGKDEVSASERLGLFSCAQVVPSLSAEASGGCRIHGKQYKCTSCLCLLAQGEKNAT